MGRVEWSVGYGNPEMWLSSSYVTWARETAVITLSHALALIPWLHCGKAAGPQRNHCINSCLVLSSSKMILPYVGDKWQALFRG